MNSTLKPRFGCVNYELERDKQKQLHYVQVYKKSAHLAFIKIKESRTNTPIQETAFLLMRTAYQSQPFITQKSADLTKQNR